MVVLALAAWLDFRHRKIPNAISYGSVLLGLLLSAFEGTFSGALIGMGLCGGLFFFFWLCRAMGGGDVKLMAGVGAFLGWPDVLDALFFTALVGGVLAILYMVWQRTPSKDDEGNELPRRKTPIPYGVAIAAGTLLSIVL